LIGFGSEDEGYISEWEIPGVNKGNFIGAADWVTVLLQDGENIWNASGNDGAVRIWNLPTKQLIKVHPSNAWHLVLWKGNIVSGGPH